MRKLNVITILSLFVVLLSVTGCIKENMDDCKGKVSLRFRYVGDGTTDIFPEKIDQVTLYVYSAEDGSLVSTVICDKSQLNTYQGIDLDLFPGNYKIVCWGNAFDATEIREPEKKIAAPGYFSGEEIATNDPLYYGTLDFNVPATLVHQDYTCDFESAHINIEVRLEGFVGAVVPGFNSENTSIALGMAHLPSFTDFSNVPSATEQSVYYPVLEVASDDPESYVTQYNVLRFGNDTPAVLQLFVGSDRTVVQEFSLADFLSEYNIQVEGRNEVTISILLRASTVGVEIIDWDKENVDPGFDKD